MVVTAGRGAFSTNILSLSIYITHFRRRYINLETESNQLGLIAKKLDMLIAITRLAYRESIDTLAKQIRSDPISARILEFASEPMAYGLLSKQVAEATGAAEITVKRKIADLRDAGVLAVRKQGRDAIYENAGLLE
jgi:DNA-binding transcriptional ArsR family regulator